MSAENGSPFDLAYLLTPEETARRIGIGNLTDFWKHVKFDSTFPTPIRRELEPKKLADGTMQRRYAHPRWDLREVVAWMDKLKAAERESLEKVKHLMEMASRSSPRTVAQRIGLKP